MRGLPTIRFANDKAVARVTKDIARAKANAAEWLRRARVALDEGNHELYTNLTARAGEEVAHLS